MKKVSGTGKKSKSKIFLFLLLFIILAGFATFIAELLGFIDIRGVDLDSIRAKMPFELKPKPKQIQKKTKGKYLDGRSLFAKPIEKAKNLLEKQAALIHDQNSTSQIKVTPNVSPIVEKKTSFDTKNLTQGSAESLSKPTAKVKPTENKKLKKDSSAIENDPIKGAKQIAKLWSQMDGTKVLPIIQQWKDAAIAKVLMQMDQSKAAVILGGLSPKRASNISKLIQEDASMVPKSTDL